MAVTDAAVTDSRYCQVHVRDESFREVVSNFLQQVRRPKRSNGAEVDAATGASSDSAHDCHWLPLITVDYC